jgi:hypothetical protein
MNSLKGLVQSSAIGQRLFVLAVVGLRGLLMLQQPLLQTLTLQRL